MKNLLFLTALLLTGIAAAQTDPLVGKKYSEISDPPGYEEYEPAGAGVLGPVNEEGNFVYAVSSFRKGTDAILILERMVREPNDADMTFVILRTPTFTLAQDEVIDLYDCYIDGASNPTLIAVHKDFPYDETPSATRAWLADPVKERIDPFTALSRITCLPAPSEDPPMEVLEEVAPEALPPAEESLTIEEVKQLLEEHASDPKARRKWKREQRKKRRNN